MPPTIRVTVDDRHLRATLGRVTAAQQRDARQWLRELGETIMTAAKENCPVDLGNLRATGHVQAEDGGDTVILGFGGPAAPYALVQHERLDFRHTVGKAKYLEDEFRRLTANAAGELAAVLARRRR